LAEYVGHSTIQMTLRYAHLMLGTSRIANVMDDFYASAQGEKLEPTPELAPERRGGFHRIVK
jgi:hypothetical protein